MSKCPADELTRKHLEKRGYIVAKVEFYNAYTKRMKDLFRFIDFVAMHMETREFIGIQTTSRPNLGTRIKKAKNVELTDKPTGDKVKPFDLWLACGNALEFHGWYKDDRGHWQTKTTRFESTG